MAIIIKEIKVVTIVEKKQEKEKETEPEWLAKVKELLRENKMDEQGKRKNER